MSVQKMHLKGYGMILLSALGFGSYGVWARLIGSEFDVFYQGWVRSIIVLLLLIPIALVRNDIRPVAKKDIKWLIIPVTFGVFTQVPLYYAFNNMDIGTATLIFYALFLITSYVTGALLLGERMTSIKIISLILALIGLSITFGISLQIYSFLAPFLAAVNGIASGGEVATTKIPTRKFSSLQISIYMWLGILLTHAPASLLLGETWYPIGFNVVWLSMVGYSVVGLVSFWLVIEGFKYVDASIGGLIGLLEIIFGIVFGILIFQEQLTAATIVGGCLIIASAMLPDSVTLLKKK